jgi:hypothetical protein
LYNTPLKTPTQRVICYTGCQFDSEIDIRHQLRLFSADTSQGVTSEWLGSNFDKASAASLESI